MTKRLILFGLIFCLPFQLGYHFWLPQSFVASFRLDYLSPTLYFVDLLILVYLLLSHQTIKLSLLFLALATLNFFVASGNPVTLFAWLRLLEYYLLFQVLRSEENLVTKIKTPFLLSLTTILFIALLQFITQASLGGLFYLLGERPLSVLGSNIAKINFSFLHYTFQILRPYSTFSHPNSLAGYLLIVLVLLPLFTRSKGFIIVTAIVTILTFSKAAILTLFLIGILNISFLWSLSLSFLVSLTPVLISVANLPSWLQLSFASRHYLLLPSLQIIQEHWLTGVGLRQFIPNLAKLLPGNQLSYQTLQPVHNTFLLIVSEIGTLGALVLIRLMLGFVHPLVKDQETRRYLSQTAGIVLLTGSLDHYWWTLPQNQLIIVLAFALIINTYEQRRNHH